MKLESHVTSRELSERLKKLGVKQESVFAWVETESEWELRLWPTFGLDDGVIAAFTVGELGEIMKGRVMPWYSEISEKWQTTVKSAHVSEVKEAEARGLMLEYLIKNKLMTIQASDQYRIYS